MKVQCSRAGCDDPIAWEMTNKTGTLVGYLCDYHKGTWYDPRDYHTTVLAPYRRGKADYEMAKKFETGGTDKSRVPARDFDAPTWLAGGAGTDSGVESGGAEPYSLPALSPALAPGAEGNRPLSAFPAATLPQAEEVRQYGALDLTKEQKDILGREIQPDRVEIRPDGQVYAPWTEYADRLDEAFGAGSWTLVPVGNPQIQDEFVCWQFDLWIRRHWVSTAIGEHPDPKKRRMSLANRAEAAKSDALVKNCKTLGIFRELWDISWQLRWQADWTIRVWALQTEYSPKGAWLYRRTDRSPFYREKPAKESDIEQGGRKRDFDDDAREHIQEIARRNA